MEVSVSQAHLHHRSWANVHSLMGRSVHWVFSSQGSGGSGVSGISELIPQKVKGTPLWKGGSCLVPWVRQAAGWGRMMEQIDTAAQPAATFLDIWILRAGRGKATRTWSQSLPFGSPAGSSGSRGDLWVPGGSQAQEEDLVPTPKLRVTWLFTSLHCLLLLCVNFYLQTNDL